MLFTRENNQQGINVKEHKKLISPESGNSVFSLLKRLVFPVMPFPRLSRHSPTWKHIRFSFPILHDLTPFRRRAQCIILLGALIPLKLYRKKVDN